MRKPLFGALAFAAMTWLAQAQDKPGAPKPATDQPPSEKTTLPAPGKELPGAKTGPSEKDKSAPQKGAAPAAGTAKTEPPEGEPAKVDPTLADWDKLKGEWISANFEFDGRSYPADGRWSLIFAKEKNKEAIKVNGNPPTQVFWTGPVRLDATKSPGEITLVLPALIGERLQRGIYTLNGDYLTIGWGTGFDAPRPASFAIKSDLETDANKHVKAESSWFIATWVRKKLPPPK